MDNIAYFITSHGFGHAARASAVMEALLDLRHDFFFHIYTSIPAWFFEISVPGAFQFHPLQTDVGIVQSGPLSEDLDQTLSQLAELYPARSQTIQQLSEELINNKCRLVICDISAIGLMAAKQAGLSSILIENFTWDWIYEAYITKKPEFREFVIYLHAQYKLASSHIQTIPFCLEAPGRTLQVPPVSRKNKTSRQETRSRLGITRRKKMVLVTLGGIRTNFSFLNQLQRFSNAVFVIPGASNQPEQSGNLILLPHHNQFYHPDLIQASDTVIAKIGYSTIAEAYYAGAPIGYIPRPGFRESQPLEKFILANFSAIPLPIADFNSGDWQGILSQLLELPVKPHSEINGANQIASWIERTI